MSQLSMLVSWSLGQLPCRGRAREVRDELRDERIVVARSRRCATRELSMVVSWSHARGVR